MPDSIILLPILFLPLGAILFALVSTKIPQPARRWLPILLLTIEIIALLLTIAPSPHRFEISSWDLASFSIVFQLDGIALVLLLAIFIPLVALQLAAPQVSFDAFVLFVLSSAIFLVCANNLMTIFFAWAILDYALFAWREARGIPHAIAMRALILGQLAGLALFMGFILIGAKQSGNGAILITLAFWARLGLFPFHWVFPNADLQTLELAAIRGAPLIASASLWLRWDRLGITLPNDLIATLAVLALIAALVWIRREEEPAALVAMSVSSATVAVPVAIAFGGDAGHAFGLWLALGIAFALAMFRLAMTWQSDYQNRWARLFFIGGILSLAGIPLTPTFLGRMGLYVAMAEKGQLFLLLIAPLAMTFVLAPLWRIGVALRATEQREPTTREYAGTQLLGLTFIAITFSALVLAQGIGQTMSDSANQALTMVIRTNDFIGVGVGSITLLAPILFSFGIARVDWGYHTQWDELIRFAARVLDLDWLARLITSVGRKSSALAGNLSALAEENPTVWILLVGLWIAIFILTSR